ncbi:MAG: choice-of-anchor D domain-containing protein [Myxococcales bacterium]
MYRTLFRRAIVVSLAAAWQSCLGGCNCKTRPNLVGEAPVAVSPSSLDFGQVRVGTQLGKAVAISNNGTAPLHILSASVSETDDGGGPVQFETPGFTSTVLDPGAALPLQVVFVPGSAGLHTATLTVATDSSPTPTVAVSLSGTGVTLSLSVSPSALGFGCEVVGGQSKPQTVTLQNGATPPEEEIVTLSQSGGGDFQLSGSGSTIELAPGASATFSVAFAPTSLGAKQESLEITLCQVDGGACPAPITLELSGDGAGTGLVATPDPLSFPYLPAGDGDSASVTVQAVSLSDAGACSLPALVSEPSLLAGDAGFTLLLDGGWPATLSPGQSFPLWVGFTSTGGGQAWDVATLPFSVGGIGQPTLDIPLQAQVVPGPCQLTVTPPAVAFGTVARGQTVTEKVLVCNDGSAFCDMSSVAVTQNDTADEFWVSDAGVDGQVAFAPGQCETVDVAFTTSNTNPPLSRRGTLTLTSDPIGGDGGLSLSEIPLSATVANWAYTGQVIVAGGYDQNSTPLDSSEIYDQTSGSWTLTKSSLTAPRAAHTATLLTTGDILVAGGQNSTGALTSSELFDPATGGWTATAGPLTYAPGSLPVTGLLPSGQVLVAGGDGNGFESASTLYDPVSQTWSATGSLHYGINNCPFGLLPSGQLLVAGGALACCYQTDTLAGELYDPVAGTWSVTGNMLEGVIWNSGAVLPSGDFLVVGGLDTGGNPTADCELYHAAGPQAGTFTAAGALNTARTSNGEVALLPSGKVLVAGGSANSTPLASAELYDPATDAWTPTGSLNTARFGAATTVLPSGKVLIAGGYGSGSAAISSCELYDPVAGTWTATGSLSTPRTWHTATVLPQ